MSNILTPIDYPQEFPSQKPDEEVILILRKHGATLIWPFTKGGVLLALATTLPFIGKLAFYIFNYKSLALIYFTWIIFWVCYLIYEYLNWYRDRFIITNDRVINIDQKSLFRRKVSEVSLDKIQDIAHELNGPLAMAFNFGNVIISSAGSDNIELRDIPNPAEIQTALFKLAKEATDDPPVTVDELVDFIKHKRI